MVETPDQFPQHLIFSLFFQPFVQLPNTSPQVNLPYFTRNGEEFAHHIFYSLYQQTLHKSHKILPRSYM